jgi:hypothetical protein
MQYKSINSPNSNLEKCFIKRKHIIDTLSLGSTKNFLTNNHPKEFIVSFIKQGNIVFRMKFLQN